MMLYEIVLDGKRYMVDVDDSVVNCSDIKKDVTNMNVQPQSNNETKKDDFDFDDLPDFDFGDDTESNVICTTLQGRVVKINVQSGDAVKSNDVLAVLESMKMEIQVIAPYDCIIKQICIHEGDVLKANSEAFIVEAV